MATPALAMSPPSLLLPSLYQTPINQNTSPSGPLTLALALAPNGHLSLTTDAGVSHQRTIPAPKPIGPRAIITLLGDRHTLYREWLTVSTLIDVVQRKVQALHQAQVKDGAGVLLQGVSFNDDRITEGQEDSMTSRLQRASTRIIGPILPQAFARMARDHLGQPDISTRGWEWDATEGQGGGSRNGHSFAGMHSGLADMGNLLEHGQAPSDSDSVIRSSLLPGPPTVLAHYMIYVVPLSMASVGSELSPRAKEKARETAPRLSGVLTAILPDPSLTEQATISEDQSVVEMHRALSSNLALAASGPQDAVSLFGPGASTDASAKGSTSPKSSPTHTLDSSTATILKGVKAYMSGFEAPSASKDTRKRGRDEVTQDASDKKQKIELTDAKRSEAPGTLPRPNPVVWKGAITWELGDPSGKGEKRSITLWVSAAEAIPGGSRSPLLTPWPAMLSLVTLKPISIQILQQHVSSNSIASVLLSPLQARDLTQPNVTGDQRLPGSAAELPQSELAYHNLARTLHSKQSGVWLPLSKGNPGGVRMNPDDSRKTAGLLVIAFGAGSSTQQQPGAARPAVKLLGLIFPQGVPWEKLQSSEQVQARQREALIAARQQQLQLQQRQQQMAAAGASGAPLNVQATAQRPNEVGPPAAALAQAQQMIEAAARAKLAGQGPAQGQNQSQQSMGPTQQQQQQWQAGQQARPFNLNLPQHINNAANFTAAAQSWIADQQKQQQQRGQNQPQQQQQQAMPGFAPTGAGGAQAQQQRSAAQPDFSAIAAQLGIQLGGNANTPNPAAASTATAAQLSLQQQQQASNLAAYQAFLKNQSQAALQGTNGNASNSGTGTGAGAGGGGGGPVPPNLTQYALEQQQRARTQAVPQQQQNEQPQQQQQQDQQQVQQPQQQQQNLIPNGLDLSKFDIGQLQAMLGMK